MYPTRRPDRNPWYLGQPHVEEVSSRVGPGRSILGGIANFGRRVSRGLADLGGGPGSLSGMMQSFQGPGYMTPRERRMENDMAALFAGDDELLDLAKVSPRAAMEQYGLQSDRAYAGEQRDDERAYQRTLTEEERAYQDRVRNAQNEHDLKVAARRAALTGQPASIEEYNLARSQGYQDTFRNWLKERHQRFSTVNFGGEDWLIDNTGLAPPQRMADLQANLSAEEQMSAAGARGTEVGRAEGEAQALEVPGSTANRERRAELASITGTLAEGDAQVELMNQEIDAAIQQINGWSAGVFADAIPFNQRREDLNGRMRTIVNQVAMSYLQRLKAASPSGATGFGALSDGERMMLESMLAAMDTAQSPAQLIEQLSMLKQRFASAQGRAHQLARLRFGNALDEYALDGPGRADPAAAAAAAAWDEEAGMPR